MFTPDGTVEVDLPAGTWTNYLMGDRVEDGRWRTETYGFTSMPIYVREGAVLPIGARDDRPDYDYLDGLTLRVYRDRTARPLSR